MAHRYVFEAKAAANAPVCYERVAALAMIAAEYRYEYYVHRAVCCFELQTRSRKPYAYCYTWEMSARVSSAQHDAGPAALRGCWEVRSPKSYRAGAWTERWDPTAARHFHC